MGTVLKSQFRSFFFEKLKDYKLLNFLILMLDWMKLKKKKADTDEYQLQRKLMRA